MVINFIIIVLQIRLVWPGPLTVPKLLYYFNRYVSIAGIIMINYSMHILTLLIRL